MGAIAWAAAAVVEAVVAAAAVADDWAEVEDEAPMEPDPAVPRTAGSEEEDTSHDSAVAAEEDTLPDFAGWVAEASEVGGAMAPAARPNALLPPWNS